MPAVIITLLFASAVGVPYEVVRCRAVRPASVTTSVKRRTTAVVLARPPDESLDDADLKSVDKRAFKRALYAVRDEDAALDYLVMAYAATVTDVAELTGLLDLTAPAVHLLLGLGRGVV